MTHRIYVIGGTHEQADAYIRSQNGRVRRAVEFVNLSRPEQLLSLSRPSVVVTDGFQDRPDKWEWERALKGRRVILCELEGIHAM